jgi:hypothetical protein
MYTDVINQKDYTCLDGFITGMMDYRMKKVGLTNSHFGKIPQQDYENRI